MGIWGMETEFGAFEGSDNVIRSLASLAFVHFRGDYFRDELISALSILEEGDISPRDMVGSWAGAMGQTQFMPSSFLEYAVDFDGGGRRDIWTNAPDAIGSTANYLAKHGWKRGLPWGFEVRLPDDFALDGRRFVDPRRVSPPSPDAASSAPTARAMPTVGEAQLLIPAGLRGPIFLVTDEFQGDQELQQLDLLRARRRPARRRDPRRPEDCGPLGRFMISADAVRGQGVAERGCANWGMKSAISTGGSATRFAPRSGNIRAVSDFRPTAMRRQRC